MTVNNTSFININWNQDDFNCEKQFLKETKVKKKSYSDSDSDGEDSDDIRDQLNLASIDQLSDTPIHAYKATRTRDCSEAVLDRKVGYSEDVDPENYYQDAYTIITNDHFTRSILVDHFNIYVRTQHKPRDGRPPKLIYNIKHIAEPALGGYHIINSQSPHALLLYGKIISTNGVVAAKFNQAYGNGEPKASSFFPPEIVFNTPSFIAAHKHMTTIAKGEHIELCSVHQLPYLVELCRIDQIIVKTIYPIFFFAHLDHEDTHMIIKGENGVPSDVILKKARKAFQKDPNNTIKYQVTKDSLIRDPIVDMGPLLNLAVNQGIYIQIPLNKLVAR